MSTKKAPEKKKTLNELIEEYDRLYMNIENYLYVLGADPLIVKEIIEDLKSQMCIHADDNINDMIADLLLLEEEISRVKQEEEKNKQPQPQ